MSTKQLIALWYGGLGVSGVLLFQASEDSSTGPLLLAIVLLAGLAIYTFRPHPRADKRQALSFVFGPVMFLAIGMASIEFVTVYRSSQALDVPASLEVTQVSSGWFDAGLDPLGRNKIVPSVSFRLENETPDELAYLQVNAVFRRKGDDEEWGNSHVRAVGTEGLAPGEATSVLRLDSGRGYTGEQSPAEILAHRDFVDAQADLFIKHRGDQWAFLDSVDVDRQFLAP
jgi:hypothetical protein